MAHKGNLAANWLRYGGKSNDEGQENKRSKGHEDLGVGLLINEERVTFKVNNTKHIVHNRHISLI